MTRTLLTLLVLAALAATVAPLGPATSSDLPALDAAKWYNAPPLTLEDLEGKAVMIEVFRTW